MIKVKKTSDSLFPHSLHTSVDDEAYVHKKMMEQKLIPNQKRYT